MSSPGGFLESGHWQGSMAQPSPNPDNDEGTDAGVSVRPMRLKVLYTFDDQNKTNCLARWPQVLQIRTVIMDEGASIGVIELKTCIQAIVQCSPELVAKLGQDYTVYAYDYSEYDNPMVGQGMLSWALAAVSPTPNAPAHQSQQLITGRVCKNIQGLFSNGVAETLEVKLRLVPVPTMLQSEYLANMERYRDLNRGTPTGSNADEWQSFIQSNPGLIQMANNFNAPLSNPSIQRGGASMEVVNQLLSPHMQQQDPTMNQFGNSAFADFSAAGSRDPTPVDGRKSVQKTSRPSSRTSTKRPRKSRAKSTVTGGNTSGYEEGTDGDDGPAPRKRAKIMQTDWNSKSGFGTASDSLRVAASTAGSLRAFRPIAIQPNTGTNVGRSHLQEMPRAPTPVPGAPSQTLGIDRGRSQSTLRRGSILSQNFDSRPRQYQSPYQAEGDVDSQDQIQPSIESAMTSPEKYDSPGDTPPDIGSSPPVLRVAQSSRSSPQIPSSPVLPQMPRTDSGFMSGDVNELFEDEEDLRPVDDEDIAVVSQYQRRRDIYPVAPKGQVQWEEVNPGPPELLPTRILPRTEQRPKAEPKQKPKPKIVRSRASRARAGSVMSDDSRVRAASKSREENAFQQTPAPDLPSSMNQPPVYADHSQSSKYPQQATSLQPQLSEIMTQPVLAPTSTTTSSFPIIRPAKRPMSRTASVGSLTLPTITASDPVLPPTGLHRSQTWSEAPYPATDAPTPRETVRGTTAGTLAKKNAQRSRLEAAIAKGEMPPFCNNCGAIETPTWRKGFAQDHKGDPGYHEYSDAPGKVTAIEILERNGDGSPTSYRIFKKSLSSDESKDAWAEILLCNPCGIWMAKYKTMRPEAKWQKDQDGRIMPPVEKKLAEKKPRERSLKPRKGQQDTQNSYASEFTSDANFQSDVFGTTDYGPIREPSEVQQSHMGPAAVQEEPQLPQRQRASSVRPSKSMNSMTSEGASAALRRAIQSSPARWLGTQHSPIELEEEDMGATRRLLFPSPRKDEDSSALCEVATNFTQPVTGLRSPLARRKGLLVASSNKENCPPVSSVHEADDVIVKLFEEVKRPSRPTTPVQTSPLPNLFKTPTRPTSNHRPITRSVSKSAKSIRSQMMPQRTPSRTPRSSARRRSPRNNQAVFESPFTATLKELMSEANHNENHHTNESPSRHLDLGLDFSNLPDLGHSGSVGMHSDALNFHLPYDGNHDFFSTDFPMPSSPPRLFNVFEDSTTMGLSGMDSMEQMWSDFPMDDNAIQSMGDGLTVDANGRASFDLPANGASIKIEAIASSTESQKSIQGQDT